MEEANHIAKEKFQCSYCTLNENYVYYGRQPPFNSKIKFKEECYIMKDPFSPSKYNFLVLGSKCSICSKVVCHNQDCSLFFSKRFCFSCVRDHLSDFPKEIQLKFLKTHS